MPGPKPIIKTKCPIITNVLASGVTTLLIDREGKLWQWAPADCAVHEVKVVPYDAS